ncbi:MAG: formyltransferase [Proteobacteria bacterium]|nr:formyltransferase [Pseudomonadota bacterium]
MPARAVVFAYHNVGATALRTLVAHGVDVALVVTHDDNPAETLWFERVADVATALGVPWITPADPNAPDVVARIAALAPDFLFSFYYRQMLGPALLATARRGALNLHGSLLPRYRGRVPVNWAVLHGETETGVTLHYMDVKPDAGDIVAQRAVPIGPDDTAKIVFDRVTAASATLLDDVLPALVAGTAPRRRNDLAQGSYFGGRKPEDGRIDFTQPAAAIHNLVRAVAPPYPGAFTDVAERRVRILATARDVPAEARATAHAPGLFGVGGTLYIAGGDGGMLRVLAADCDGLPFDAAAWAAATTRRG